MKELLKNLLKSIGLYHPLQLFYRNSLQGLYHLRLRRKYGNLKGSGFTCNYCGASYKHFEPSYPKPQDRHAIESNHVIAGFGENIICPSCMCNARERLVIAVLNDLIYYKGKKILLLSPEKVIFSFLKKDSKIITADLFPGFYKGIDPEIGKQDITSMSFASETFDMVIANHVMEHIPDDKMAMNEIYRVLIPGGHAILQAPFSETLPSTIETPDLKDPKEQSRLYGQRDHVRIYALPGYIQRLRECGFIVELIPYAELTKYYKNAIQEGEHFLKISKPFISE